MDDIFDTSEVALMQNIEDKWLMCRIYFPFPGCISNVAILIWKRVLWVKRSFFFFTPNRFVLQIQIRAQLERTFCNMRLVKPDVMAPKI